jgi:hypothetical protein
VEPWAWKKPPSTSLATFLMIASASSRALSMSALGLRGSAGIASQAVVSISCSEGLIFMPTARVGQGAHQAALLRGVHGDGNREGAWKASCLVIEVQPKQEHGVGNPAPPQKPCLDSIKATARQGPTRV